MVDRAAQVRSITATERGRGVATSEDRLTSKSPQGAAVSVVEPNLPKQSRLPKEKPLEKGADWATSKGGSWIGEPGNGEWASDNQVVNQITKNRSIQFKDGYPDFRPWMKERVFIKDMKGTESDFSKANRALALQKKWLNKKGEPIIVRAEEYMKKQGLTWHHVEGAGKGELIAVPTALHENVPHMGSASEARENLAANAKTTTKPAEVEKKPVASKTQVADEKPAKKVPKPAPMSAPIPQNPQVKPVPKPKAPVSVKEAPTEPGAILPKGELTKPVETKTGPIAAPTKLASAKPEHNPTTLTSASVPQSPPVEPVPQPKASVKVSPAPAPATIPGPPIEPGGILLGTGSTAPETHGPVSSTPPSLLEPVPQAKAPAKSEPSPKTGGAPIETMTRSVFPEQVPVYGGRPEKRVIEPFEHKPGYEGPKNYTGATEGAAVLLVEIEEALQREAVVRDARLSSSLRTLRWWLQRGVVPPAKGVTDRWFSGAERTDNIDEIVSGAEKERFQGVEVGKLDDPQQYEAFEEWVTGNIHSLEDLYFHFVYHQDSGVRWNLANGRWELITWEWGEWGFNNVSETRVEDDRISRFMEGIRVQIVTQTKNAIDLLGSNRPPVVQDAQVKIAGIRRFRVGGFVDRSLYDPYTRQRLMFAFQWSKPPVFYEIVAQGVPDNYVLVTGADLPTYLTIHDRRSSYGTVSHGPTIGPPPKYDRTKPYTGWNSINIPVVLVLKEALTPDGG